MTLHLEDAGSEGAYPDSHCDQVRQRLVPFLDGELVAEQRERVQEHVAGCVDCRRQLNRHRATAASLDRVLEARLKSPSPLGADLAERVRERARDEHRRHTQRIARQLRIALQVAACVLVAAGIWFLVQRNDHAPVVPIVASNPEVKSTPNTLPGVIQPASEIPDSDDIEADEEIIENLDVLVALDEAGVELSSELVQLLLDEPRDSLDVDMEQLLDDLLEEEKPTDQL